MLQRIQSLYFLGAISLHVCFLFVPIATLHIEKIKAINNVGLAILSIGIDLLMVLAIFQFTNRKRQMLLCRILVLALAAELVFALLTVSGDSQNTLQQYSWGAVLPIVSLLLILFAHKAIAHDERLVRSADRLR